VQKKNPPKSTGETPGGPVVCDGIPSPGGGGSPSGGGSPPVVPPAITKLDLFLVRVVTNFCITTIQVHVLSNEQQKDSILEHTSIPDCFSVIRIYNSIQGNLKHVKPIRSLWG